MVDNEAGGRKHVDAIVIGAGLQVYVVQLQLLKVLVTVRKC